MVFQPPFILLAGRPCAVNKLYTVHSSPQLPNPHLHSNRCQMSRTVEQALWAKTLCLGTTHLFKLGIPSNQVDHLKKIGQRRYEAAVWKPDQRDRVQNTRWLVDCIWEGILEESVTQCWQGQNSLCCSPCSQLGPHGAVVITQYFCMRAAQTGIVSKATVPQPSALSRLASQRGWSREEQFQQLKWPWQQQQPQQQQQQQCRSPQKW